MTEFTTLLPPSVLHVTREIVREMNVATRASGGWESCVRGLVLSRWG